MVILVLILLFLSCTCIYYSSRRCIYYSSRRCDRFDVEDNRHGGGGGGHGATTAAVNSKINKNPPDDLGE